MKRYIYGALTAAAGFAPALAFAQTGINQGGILGVLQIAQRILDYTVVLIISLAIVYFLWNVVKYIKSGGADDKEASKKGILYSLIGIAVMVSVWGLVRILQGTFISGDTNTPIQTPSLPSVR